MENKRKRAGRRADPGQDALTLLLIVAVCFVQAIAINGFYVPHGFLSGGVTGLSMLINYLTDLPAWLLIVALNIPICLVGLKHLRKKMVLFSAIATAGLSGAYALTAGIDFGVENPILSALAGAAVIGVSGAAVLPRDATMGGTDVLSVILGKRFTVPVGTFNIVFNFVVMGCLAALRGLELALTSMLAMFVCNVAFQNAYRAFFRTNTVFIISDKWNEIAPLVLHRLHRGVTYINAEGAYTGAPRKVVYCIVRTRELYQVKRFVHDIDPHAMFSIMDNQEVLGRGFGSFN